LSSVVADRASASSSDDPPRLEAVEPAHLAAGQVQLLLRQVDRRGVLLHLLVDLLDGERRLCAFPFQPRDVEFVIARIDLEEERALLHEAARAARLGLVPHPAGDLRRERDLAERHDHAVERDRQAARLRGDFDRAHQGRGPLLPALALGWRLPAEHREGGHAGAENDDRCDPAHDRANQLHGLHRMRPLGMAVGCVREAFVPAD
jgi:hypothetical protein